MANDFQHQRMLCNNEHNHICWQRGTAGSTKFKTSARQRMGLDFMICFNSVKSYFLRTLFRSRFPKTAPTSAGGMKNTK